MKVSYREGLTSTFEFYLKSKDLSWAGDPLGKALSLKRGLPAKRIAIGSDLPRLMLLPDHIRSFYQRNAVMYMIPLDDFVGNIYGFMFSAIEQKAFRVQFGSPLAFYGLQNFEGFEYGDPVIITEGIKDAEAIRKYADFPHVVGILTDYPSTHQLNVLKLMTDRLIYVGDSDSAGRRCGAKLNKYHAVRVFRTPTKDAGVVFEKDAPDLVNFLKGLGSAI